MPGAEKDSYGMTYLSELRGTAEVKLRPAELGTS
jgi:hypothetical protein